jgi:7-cyano-7-deazaguanine synthase
VSTPSDRSAPRRAVVLTSGGLDSTTTLAIARAQGFDCYALTVDYGQRHQVEIEAARRVAQELRVREHAVIAINLRRFGGSALTTDVALPTGRAPEAMTDIPATYVPARNTVFLSLALAWAETLAAEDIFIGVTAIDSSGYPDCRPEYIDAFASLANLATKAGVEGRSRFTIHTPLIRLSKAEIVRRTHELGVDLGLTWSCYDPSRAIARAACATPASCAPKDSSRPESPTPSAHDLADLHLGGDARVVRHVGHHFLAVRPHRLLELPERVEVQVTDARIRCR